VIGVLDQRINLGTELLADLVLALVKIVLRASKDHEIAVRIGEGVPILKRRPLILGRLLVAVPALVLAGLPQHLLEEFTILELVLDAIAVVGARFFPRAARSGRCCLVTCPLGRPLRLCWG
jgi:hypothetical protein